MTFFNQLQHDEDFLLHKNLDVKTDFYLNCLEREIIKLPESLHVVKDFIYNNLFRHLDSIISNLIKIKQTTNYDDDIPTIMMNQLAETKPISSLDAFNNHNIKGKIGSKIVYGTANGFIIIYDQENGKVLYENKHGETRVEIIKSSTIKYYDTYLSRIIVYYRGSTEILIFSFNHSHSSLNLEEKLNLISYSSYLQGQTSIEVNKGKEKIENKLDLCYLVSNISISRDSYFMVITNFESNSLIFKFNDLPFMFNSNQGTSLIMSEKSKLKENDELFINLISYITSPKIDDVNFNDEMKSKALLNTKDKLLNKKGNQKENKEKENKEKEKEKDKNKKNNKELVKTEPEEIKLEEGKYHIQSKFDDEGNDISALQMRSEFHCFVEFIQKKHVFEEIDSSGFSSVIITQGIYFSYYNLPIIKYLNISDYITKQMKSIFKISKIKSPITYSEEEKFNFNSKISKAEKEYFSFIKSKLEGGVGDVVINNKEKDKENKGKSIIKQNVNEVVMVSIDFSLNSKVSCISHTREYNKKYNYLVFGLKNGSIIVWDCELHCDKFYLDKGNSSDITHICLNENYITSASIDGRVYIHDLNTSKKIYEAFNDPYLNNPIRLIHPIDYYINLVIDTSNRIVLYYTKDSHKICKIILPSPNMKNRKMSGNSNFSSNVQNFYSIQNLYQPLIQSNKEYIVFIGKDNIKYNKLNVVDLINFQTKLTKSPIEKYSSSDWINWSIKENSIPYEGISFDVDEMTLFPTKYNYIHYNHIIGNKSKKSFLFSYKIKDLLIKCYPELRLAFKNKMQFKKILDSYTLSDLPSFYEGSIFNKNPSKFIGKEELNELNEIKEDDNMVREGNSDRDVKEEYTKRKSSVSNLLKNGLRNENSNSLNIGGNIGNSITNNNNKNSNLKYSNLIIEKEIEILKKGLNKVEVNNTEKVNENRNENEKEEEKIKIKESIFKAENDIVDNVNSEKKNIIYISYKNIQNRFQYKEQRANQIQMFNEKVSKDLILPIIKPNKSKK